MDAQQFVNAYRTPPVLKERNSIRGLFNRIKHQNLVEQRTKAFNNMDPHTQESILQDYANYIDSKPGTGPAFNDISRPTLSFLN
jgi:hypothetical protein